MPISSGDLTNMRIGQQTVVPHLNVTPKVVMGTMLVNETYLFFPEWQFTFDNAAWNGGISMLNVPIGSQVWIGTSSGAHDVMVTTVTGNSVSNQIFTPAFGKGDPGYASLDVQALANNQYVTVLANRAPWGALSTIRNGVFYKQGSQQYTDQGSSPPPVCNIGPWRRAELSGASVTLSFTNAAQTDVKPASFAWGSKTVLSYAWSVRNEDYDLNTGASFDGGISNTETVSITFDTAGFYIVSCVITDSDSKTHQADTYVWIVDGTNEADITGWRIESDTQTRQGRRMTIQMYGDVAESVVFPGAGFLYTETQTYNGNAVTAGATVNTFVGFVDQEKGIRTLDNGLVEFDILGPGHIMEKLPAASQYIEEATSPANWTQATNDLTNPNGIAWYILAHHAPNMIAMLDFWPLQKVTTGQIDLDFRDKNWVLNGKSIWAQLKEITPHQINVGSLSSGAIILRHLPGLMSATDKAALDVRMTWTAKDIREKLEYPAETRLNVGQVDVYAFSYTTISHAWWSRAPGDAQSQGTYKREINGLILGTTDTQTTLNRISGALFAMFNNPTPRMVIPAKRNLDTADPAMLAWHKLTISDALDPRGSGYTDRYILPLQVNRRWKQENKVWLKEVDQTVETVPDGEPGVAKQVPVAVDEQWLPLYEWQQFGDYAIEEPPDTGTAPTSLIAISNTAAKVVRHTSTDNFATPPGWEDIGSGLSGEGRWLTADPFSYKRYYAATTGGLFVCDNVRAIKPIWYQVLDTGRLPAASASEGYHQVVMTGNRQGYIILVHNMVHLDISFDYGNTWQTVFMREDGQPEYAPGFPRSYWGEVQISGWNTTDTGVLYGRRNNLLLGSNDWGLTWSRLAISTSNWYTEFGCGSVMVPYLRGDGTPNTWEDDKQELYLVAGSDGNVAGYRYSVLKSSANGGSGTWGYIINNSGAGNWTGIRHGAFRPMVAYTQNGDLIYIVEQVIVGPSGFPSTRIVYTPDGGTTIIPLASSPSVTTGLDAANLNGWPYDEEFLVYWAWRESPSTGELKVTYDRGENWANALGDFASVTGSSEVAYVEAMLSDVQ